MEAKVIEVHNCRLIDIAKDISINKRCMKDKDRWLWERTAKGRIDADEVIFCPYCGEHLK